MTAEQLELLRAVAQWFYDNAPTAVLPGGKDTALNDITRLIIRDDANKTLQLFQKKVLTVTIGDE